MLQPLPNFWRHIETVSRNSRHAWPVQLSVEVDVSALRELRRACRAAGRIVPSYTAAVAKAIAAGLFEFSRDPRYVGFNSCLVQVPFRRLARFDSVCGGLMVEREIDGQDMAFMSVLRDLEQKSLEEITTELGDLSRKPIQELPGLQRALDFMRWPAPLRWLVMWLISNLPSLRQAHYGSFCLTTVGKYGPDLQFPAVGDRAPSFGFGRVAERAIVVNGRIRVRPTLHLCCVFDRRMMNGAPAARLLHRIKELLETMREEGLARVSGQGWPVESSVAGSAACKGGPGDKP